MHGILTGVSSKLIESSDAIILTLLPPIKKNGVMIDDNRNAIVGGLATPTFEDGWLAPLRWLAPELVDEYRRVDKSTQADVYSFAMTAYEVGQ